MIEVNVPCGHIVGLLGQEFTIMSDTEKIYVSCKVCKFASSCGSFRDWLLKNREEVMGLRL